LTNVVTHDTLSYMSETNESTAAASGPCAICTTTSDTKATATKPDGKTEQVFVHRLCIAVQGNGHALQEMLALRTLVESEAVFISAMVRKLGGRVMIAKADIDYVITNRIGIKESTIGESFLMENTGNASLIVTH
jgi:hypothetical protein